MLEAVRDNNDLGHPLCDNLRSGDWLPGYTANRLKLRPSVKPVADVLSTVFQYLSNLPRYLIPCYFDAILGAMHKLMLSSTKSQMSRLVSTGIMSIYNNYAITSRV